MYYDLHLQFKDKEEALTVLFTFHKYVENGEEKFEPAPKYAAVDVIGVIYTDTGEYQDVDGVKVAKKVPLPGWYVNVRHTKEMPESAKYAIQVDNPVRVWA